MAGPLDGVNPMLVQRFLALQAAARAAGHQIGVSSGFRSQQQQIDLRIKNGCPNIWTAKASQCRIPTAIPGSSNHEHGFAIDISGSSAAKGWANQHGAQFGLHFPVSGEDWHVEMIGDEGSRGFAQGSPGAIGFDVNWQERQRSPEEEMDERLGMVMNTIVGAQRDTLAGVRSPVAPEVMSPVAPEVMGPGSTAEMATPTPPEVMGPVGQTETLVNAGQAQMQQTVGPGSGGAWQGDVPPPGFVPPGKGVDRWRDVALAALRYTGQNESWLPLLLRRMNQESGGNPTIVNKWDSNWKKGDPSIGLMQNIGSAFPERARELSGRGITDGFANIVASIRYTLNRYGSLNAWGKPGGY
jgi:hypothetical protein